MGKPGIVMPKTPAPGQQTRRRIFFLGDLRQLVWPGVAIAQFLALATLYIAITEAFFSLGGSIGAGVLTLFIGLVVGAVQALIGTVVLAKAYYSRGKVGPAAYSWAGALLAAMAMLTLVILALQSGPMRIASVLRIYIWSPGGRMMPRDASRLLSGAVLTSIFAFAANCVAGVVMARLRSRQEVDSKQQEPSGRLKWCWRIVMGLGGAALLTLLVTVLTSVVSGWPPAIHRAVEAGQLAAAEEVLADDPSAVRASDFRGDTALVLATRQGRLDMVKLLVDRGADVNVSDRHGFTPLHSAVGKGRTAIVALLLQNGAEVRTEAEMGGTPLHSAAFWGHREVAELLISHGADVNARQRMGGKTPLALAEEKGHADLARLLRDNGAVEERE
jgi:hypothetical protein